MAVFRKMFPLIMVIMALLAINSDKACAGDPDMLQDVCVADLTSRATNNTFGSLVTGANVMAIPGLNTLGVSMARIDYAPGGINPPHLHPRATEMIYVLQGELDVGFITTANVLVAKHIVQGEVFVFPRGLVHFQKNNGHMPAAVIAGFNSQLAGTQSIATTLFAATPAPGVPNDILAQAFQIGTMQVQQIKAKFAPRN
ncbi:hypothetical protein H5410_011077 [Solanum commersonii]|uniref:Germin-like protein n=1 Tax=Solanum commersonii TaxID=4109 RepID=A0A9J6ANM0_SOLCO|nr:hypothetical protein H5410_011077 [Solanum commersonii]